MLDTNSEFLKEACLQSLLVVSPFHALACVGFLCIANWNQEEDLPFIHLPAGKESAIDIF